MLEHSLSLGVAKQLGVLALGLSFYVGLQRRMRVKNIGGEAEYPVAVRPRQGRGCGKGDVLPSKFPHRA